PSGNNILFITKNRTSGTGFGRVTSAPPGIDCGSSCVSNFTPGTTVTLTAAPDPGSIFSGWALGCTGSGTCTVTILSNTFVDAVFDAQQGQRPQLAVVPMGTGSGTVTSSDGGINCGTTCNATYDTGTVVTLTAAPAAGSTFGGGGCGCAGTSPTSPMTTRRARSVAATSNLQQQQFTLTVTPGGTGSGTVTSNDGLISCPGTCSATYNSGANVTLTA